MKIRIEVSSTATYHPSGIGYYTERLTNALAEAPSTTVYASYFNFLDRQPNPRFNPKVRIENTILFPLRVYAKFQSHRLAPAFDFFKEELVDLTIFPNYARWPRIHSTYTATAIHDLTYINHPELMEKNNLPHLQRVVPRAIKNSDFILTVSETVKKELIQAFHLHPDKIVVTPVPPNERFSVKNNTDVKKKYAIPTKDYLLYLGNIEPRKNIPTLIKAYEQLPKKLQEKYSLVIAGGVGWKGEESLAAIEKAKKKGLQIIQTGYIDEQDKSALFQQATVFILPSVYEGFGMPILEAFASKTPVITSDIPVLREAGGAGALYFPPKNATTLANLITKLVKSSTLQKELVKKGSLHLKSFSWKINAERIIAAVDKLASH